MSGVPVTVILKLARRDSRRQANPATLSPGPQVRPEGDIFRRQEP